MQHPQTMSLEKGPMTYEGFGTYVSMESPYILNILNTLLLTFVCRPEIIVWNYAIQGLDSVNSIQTVGPWVVRAKKQYLIIKNKKVWFL